jgi:high-affinity nickel-transport protein
LSLRGAFWDYLSALDFEAIGFGIIILFLLSWLVSWGYWKINKFDRLKY